MKTTVKTAGYATQGPKNRLEPFSFERREVRPADVKIEVLYCGVCHSDLHVARNEWKETIYPFVPGHEIVGRVSEVGREVRGFKIGQRVAVGCLVDSCRSCPNCREHLEPYCDEGAVWTYNSRDRIDRSVTYGGYSTQIVVDEKFVLHIPDSFTESELPRVAPLLCAGITTYSPLRHWGVTKGSRVGVVGLGGLGHMAVQLAHGLGAEVTLFTTSANKVADGRRLGADEVVLSKDLQEMERRTNHFDFILNTASVSHSLDSFLKLLKRDGTLCLVGVPAESHPSPNVFSLIKKRRSLAGSNVGGLKETQELLDFCGKKHILSEIELIRMDQINEAYERMLKSDVKYRFVIDISSLK